MVEKLEWIFAFFFAWEVLQRIPCAQAISSLHLTTLVPESFLVDLEGTEYGGGLLIDGKLDDGTVRFWQPQKIRWMPQENGLPVLIIADTQNHAIRVVEFHKRQVSTLAKWNMTTISNHAESCFNTTWNNLANKSLDTCTNAPFIMPYSFAIHPTQEFLWVTDTRNRRINQISLLPPYNNNITFIPLSLGNDPIDIVWISSSSCIILTADNDLYLVNKNTLSSEQIVFNKDGIIQFLGLEYDAMENAIYVSDFGSRLIHKIVLNTPATRTVVVGNAASTGTTMSDAMLQGQNAMDAYLGGPTHMVLVGNKLYFTDRGMVGSALRVWYKDTNQVETLVGNFSSRNVVHGIWGIASFLISRQGQQWIVWDESDSNALKSIVVGMQSNTPINFSLFPCTVGQYYNLTMQNCMECTSLKPFHARYVGMGGLDNVCAWACADAPLIQPFSCLGRPMPSTKPSPYSQWFLFNGTNEIGYACNAGYHKDSQATTCNVCPENFFCDGMDFARVGSKACPSFSTSVTGSISEENCTCLSGYFREFDGTCKICPIGYYCPTQYERLACPSADSTTLHTGATNVDACICKVGFKGPNGNGPCVACNAGEICPGGNGTLLCPAFTSLAANVSTLTNTSQCRPIPGYYQTQQGTQGIPCTANFYCPGVLSSNQTQFQFACPNNSSSPTLSKSITDCKCVDGTYSVVSSPTSASCVTCPIGSYCVNGTRKSCIFANQTLTTLQTGSSTIENCVCNVTQLPSFATYISTAAQYNATLPCAWKCKALGYRKVNNTCVPCSTPTCANGSYLSGCSVDVEGVKDNVCVPCTNGPLHDFTSMQYIDSGSVSGYLGVNNCPWRCLTGYYFNGSTCALCNSTYCPSGSYRETCSTVNRTQDATCLTCIPAAPLYGDLGISSTYNTNTCPVICQRGWWFLSSKRKCCSDNSILMKATDDCVCGAGFTYPSPNLNGVVCEV